MVPDRQNIPTGFRVGFINSNLLPPLVAIAHVLASGALLGLPWHAGITLLTACGTFLIYQLDRGLPFSPEDRVNCPARLDWIRRHRGWWWGSSAVAALTALWLWLGETPIVQAGIALIALGGLLYVLPILPGRKRLKNLYLAKSLLLPLAWGLGCVVLPALSSGQNLSADVWCLALYRVLYTAPNFLLTDLPDRAGDTRAGLQSPAVRHQDRVLLRVVRGLLFSALCLLPILALLHGSPLLLAVDAVGLLLLFILAGNPARNQSDPSLLADLAVSWPAVTCMVFLGLRGL